MRKIASNDDLMTTRQAGEALGVAVRTVQLWVESGVLPAWRTAGGHRRIARSAVEKLMAERALVIDRPVPDDGKVPDKDRPFKLLLVEDDPVQRKLFTLMVKSWDFPVELTCATNGFEGLICLGQIRPDMVVTDLNMPGMDGFQMVRSLKRPGSGFDDLSVIAVTALSPIDIRDRGGLPQGVKVFQKPLRFDEIQAFVRAQLNQLDRRAAAPA